MTYNELTIDQQVYLANTVGAMGVDPAHLSEPEIERLLADFELPKTPLDDVWKSNQASAQARAWKRTQARVDALQQTANRNVDLSEVEKFSLAYGFTDQAVAEFFEQQQADAVAELARAKEEAAAIEAQLEFDRASEQARQNDFLALIQIGDNSSHPHQAQAKLLMSELWPKFDSWR